MAHKRTDFSPSWSVTPPLDIGRICRLECVDNSQPWRIICTTVDVSFLWNAQVVWNRQMGPGRVGGWVNQSYLMNCWSHVQFTVDFCGINSHSGIQSSYRHAADCWLLSRLLSTRRSVGVGPDYIAWPVPMIPWFSHAWWNAFHFLAPFSHAQIFLYHNSAHARARACIHDILI